MLRGSFGQNPNIEGDQAPTSETDRDFATTLAKGLAVLEAFQPGDRGLGNTELANRTGLSRPTAARLSSTLADLGYLKYDARRAKYRIGTRALRIAWPVLADMRVRQIARPLMQELAASVLGTVSIGIIDGLSVVYIESVRGGDIAPHTPEIGSWLPILRTAMGRALAMQLSAEERAALDSRFAIETPGTFRDFGANYRGGIVQCAERGFCVAEGDFDPSIFGAAAPLYRAADSGDCFALNCGVAAFRLKPGELVNDIGPRLKALAGTVRARIEDLGI